MKEQTERPKPIDAALLDPFGVRRISASEELREILDAETQPTPETRFLETISPEPKIWQPEEVILHYEGKWDNWTSHPQGVIIVRGNRFLLNGEQLLYEGEWRDWKPHPQGIVIERGNQLLLNGRLLYEGGWEEGDWDEWSVHPQGVIIKKGDQYLLNDKELIYEFRSYWRYHPQGVITAKFMERGGKVFISGRGIFGFGGNVDYWTIHPQGVVDTDGRKLFLNGKQLLYKGDWDAWNPHPQGVVIRRENKFLLNGKQLLYEGEWDGWEPHLQGIVIQRGNDWIFYG